MVLDYKDKGSLTKSCRQMAFFHVDLNNSQSLCIDVSGAICVMHICCEMVHKLLSFLVRLIARA